MNSFADKLAGCCDRIIILAETSLIGFISLIGRIGFGFKIISIKKGLVVGCPWRGTNSLFSECQKYKKKSPTQKTWGEGEITFSFSSTLIWTRFPATELRLVKAFALVKRKSAQKTNNFHEAGAAFIRFLFISEADAQLIQSCICVLRV